jgi:hypothetical protein
VQSTLGYFRIRTLSRNRPQEYITKTAIRKYGRQCLKGHFAHRNTHFNWILHPSATTSTTAHRLGRNGTSNNRNSENRDCIVQLHENGAKSNLRVAFSSCFGFKFCRRTFSYYFSVRSGIKKLYCEDSCKDDPCVLVYGYKRRFVLYTVAEGSTLLINFDTYVPIYMDLYSRRIQSSSLLWEIISEDVPLWLKLYQGSIFQTQISLR